MYDFGHAAHFLTHLEVRLEAASRGGGRFLRSHGVELIDAAHRLSSVVP